MASADVVDLSDFRERSRARGKVCAPSQRSRAPSPLTAGGDPRQNFGARDLPVGIFFRDRPEIRPSPHPSNARTCGPGLPHHRYQDDAIYLGLFWLVLIACASYIGWHYLSQL